MKSKVRADCSKCNLLLLYLSLGPIIIIIIIIVIFSHQYRRGRGGTGINCWGPTMLHMFLYLTGSTIICRLYKSKLADHDPATLLLTASLSYFV